jgi:hypothetical protein
LFAQNLCISLLEQNLHSTASKRSFPQSYFVKIPTLCSSTEGFQGDEANGGAGLKSNTGANSESAEISTYFSHATTYQIITKRLRDFIWLVKEFFSHRICHQPSE